MTKLGPYELNSIITGDARELAQAIPDNSVDLIFTDPVYDRIEDYEWLAKTAARILKDDRACLVWIATGLLDEIIKVMSPSLNYAWQFIWQKVGPVYPGKPGMCKYASCLWFEKGQSKTIKKIWDFYQSGASNDLPIADNGHNWRKSADNLAFWTEAFAHPNAIVFDPFTGGGTVPAVCKMLGKNYLAFEIDETTADKARQRVQMTQPPLLLPEPVQLEMIAT